MIGEVIISVMRMSRMVCINDMIWLIFGGFGFVVVMGGCLVFVCLVRYVNWYVWWWCWWRCWVWLVGFCSWLIIGWFVIVWLELFWWFFCVVVVWNRFFLRMVWLFWWWRRCWIVLFLLLGFYWWCCFLVYWFVWWWYSLVWEFLVGRFCCW